MTSDLYSTVDRVALPSDQDASGRSLGEEEVRLLEAVIASGTLTSTKGTSVKELERRFAELLGVRHAIACSSGTAAIHAAVAAIDPEPGDEIIASPITDIGGLTPVIYQSAVPVFADVDPHTYNVTAETIEARLSDRTRAIILTHLFGSPARVEEIRALADAHGIPVIEDCAQAYLTRRQGRLAGTIGSIGCFSLQQGKHITTGEGGLVVTDDDDVARRVTLFVNKAWGYGDPRPDHYFLALNSRMSELQGAVGVAQLQKLHGAVDHRIAMADRLTQRLVGTSGIECPRVEPGDVHTYWKYVLRVDSSVIDGGPVGLARRLKHYDVASAPRYIQKPAFECSVFRDQRTFGNSRFPFTLARPEAVDYSPSLFPGTYSTLDSVLVLPLNERYEDRHIDHLADSIEQAVSR
jgi:perosamine synthetase